jgi:methyl-accepting chemotaxis protein
VLEGVELVNQAGAALIEIVEATKEVAGIVHDIATASDEQAIGLGQVNQALGQMDEVTQQNSALVEQNAATAKTLEHQSMTMNELMSFFQIQRADETSKASKSADRMPKRAGAARTAQG